MWLTARRKLHDANFKGNCGLACMRHNILMIHRYPEMSVVILATKRVSNALGFMDCLLTIIGSVEGR